MKAKICGLSTAEQVQASIDYGADFCGFILNYPKSHRFINFDKAKELTNVEKKNTKYVGADIVKRIIKLNNKKYKRKNINFFLHNVYKHKEDLKTLSC